MRKSLIAQVRVLSAGLSLSSVLLAQASTTLVSVSSSGVQAGASSVFLLDASISGNGQLVVFTTDASNLVTGDTNMRADVFVHDRTTGVTSRVSVDSTGAQANDASYQATLSYDGRIVVFTSDASNLVANDTNGSADVFVHDRQIGQTTRISVSSAGAEGNQGSAVGWAALSADGRYVAFYSSATNLVTGDSNSQQDVFVHDRQTSQTTRVSISSSGAQSNDATRMPTISADGRFVAFDSLASNLVMGDTNGLSDAFVHDRHTGATVRVSVDSSGAQCTALSAWVWIAGNGSAVAFGSQDGNLVPGDTNGNTDLFVHDMLSGQTTRVSVSSAGAQAVSGGSGGWLSHDGRYVTILSPSGNLVAGDTNGVSDVFVHDRETGSIERVSLSSTGQQAVGGGGIAHIPSMSADGRALAFISLSSNLVSGDINNSYDVFVRDRGPQYSVQRYCSGDGSGTACPCSNAGALLSGCASSVSLTGANLSGSGEARISGDSIVLFGTGMPNSSALYFQGTASENGGAGSTFGDGLRCAAGSIVRLATKTNVSGASRYPGGGDRSISVRGMVMAAGIRTYQVWYRNAAAFCTPSTFNLTNGLSVTWTP